MRALNASTSIHLVELAQKCLHEVPVPDRSGSIWQHSTSPSDKQRRTETSKLCSDPLDFRAQTSRRTPGRNKSMRDTLSPESKAIRVRSLTMQRRQARTTRTRASACQNSTCTPWPQCEAHKHANQRFCVELILRPMSNALIQTIDELLRDELRLPLAELRVTSNLRRLQEARTLKIGVSM